MSRTNLFFKVEVEHEEDELPEKLGDEICRKLMKIYAVRSAEFTNYTELD